MAADWHELGDEYQAGSGSKVLIADVDCTADDAKDLCEKFSIKGYPTLKTFTEGDVTVGEDYQGARNLDGLRAFVEENLAGGFCDVTSAEDENCSDKERAYITKMGAKSAADRQAQIARLEGMVGNSMKVELKRWLNQRLGILRQFDVAKDEL